jgi:diguanylate cyclase (GGDEF)-like protein/PAS domain S-box-containing protein
MTNPPGSRPSLTPASVLVGAILAGTFLYLVPTLALDGSAIHATLVAGAIGAGLAALWILHHRELRDRQRALDREKAGAALFRRVLDEAAESFLILNHEGEVRFASENVKRILEKEGGRLENGGLLDLLRPEDRRRVVQGFARVRRQPRTSVTLEAATVDTGRGERFLEIRAVNLLDDAEVQGVLVGVRDITPRKAFETQIQHLAYYDALTGLANRRFFFEQGAKALSMARRRRHASAVLYLDLDRFKQVNDLLGHEVGDDLLKSVANELRRALRDTDVLARLGGDEFAVVLAEVRDVEAAHRVAHRILDQMPTGAFAAGHEVSVAASIGLAMFPEDGETLTDLLKAADLAMYRAKSEALGVQLYRPELRELMSDRMRMEQDMRRALERHEFQLHYQPIVHVASGAVAGAEALSRWRHFARGMVATAEFIELAETSGLIRSLDRWAMARALHQRAAGIGGGFNGWIAVNLSPQSMTDPELPDYVRALIQQYRIEPGALVLELPDSAVGIDTRAAADLMWKLKDTGAAIALDDFGSGRTSLADLRTLPIDILKLDAEFIRPLGQDEADECMVDGAIAIARAIRAKVLAKGVERPDQVDWLREAGCDFIQGFLTGAPAPAEDLAAPPAR